MCSACSSQPQTRQAHQHPRPPRARPQPQPSTQAPRNGERHGCTVDALTMPLFHSPCHCFVVNTLVRSLRHPLAPPTMDHATVCSCLRHTDTPSLTHACAVCVCVSAAALIFACSVGSRSRSMRSHQQDIACYTILGRVLSLCRVTHLFAPRRCLLPKVCQGPDCQGPECIQDLDNCVCLSWSCLSHRL